MASGNYPQPLSNALAAFGVKPTGNVEWDKSTLQKLKYDRDNADTWVALGNIVRKIHHDMKEPVSEYPDMLNPEVFKAHADLLIMIANDIVLRPQRRTFVIDENNRQVIRFLLYYFNDCPKCEEIFPGRGYKTHKNLLLQGGVGVGKTLLMQVFSEYLRRINSPRSFHNVSVTQMVNYYSINNNIDKLLYNDKDSNTLEGNPLNICLHDIGVESKNYKHYGTDVTLLTDQFLFARNEIWANEHNRKFAHLTTNLTENELRTKFQDKDKDEYGRIVDRFKTYNVIPITGASRR